MLWTERYKFLKNQSKDKTTCNVKPSQKLAPRGIQLFPYCKGNLHFLIKFQFQGSDFIASEKLHFYKFFVHNKNCFVTHPNDIGKSYTPFRRGLKPGSNLQTQRPTKTPVHFMENWTLYSMIFEIRIEWTNWINASTKTKNWNHFSKTNNPTTLNSTKNQSSESKPL